MTFNSQYLLSLLTSTQTLMGVVVPLLIGLGLVLFLWSLLKFLRTDSVEEKKKAKSAMLWGVFILFVMVSVWGIVKIVQGTFGIKGTETVVSPALPQ